ncbi:MAG TPA: signal recognition particle-docking protein FtsY [Candidatus Choladousia intestinavium]|uniref:Signal recognition particle receptor FtsY n=1 Tax=Candidatus Choladousia intestinavium TaxID=2840727 RepID=A0A9D1ADR6_9FIRM|nr:signal recognition particle-docking protein FtsY [Candidatus Choladousia intestinavium]
MEEKKGFFKRLVAGLTKTRNNIVSGIDAIFRGFSSIDDDFYDEIEEILVMGDIGINATTSIIEDLKAQVKEKNIKEPSECKQLLIDSIKQQMNVGETAYEFENRRSVVLVIGVNGVGKTTSVGKLAGKLTDQGKKVILAAADTFRAAAGEQLTEWARRAGVDIIGGQEGSDPGSVVYDAIAAAKARKADVLLIDTAGRLHNKKNLMNELGKINRILEREYPEAYRETLVVLDGTTGQNALAQAREFKEVTDITGIILTKLDGTAKGGIAVAIHSELGIPVKYIGVGESIEDLQKFDADEFVNALFDISNE